jgi:hypothetical protein
MMPSRRHTLGDCHDLAWALTFGTLLLADNNGVRIMATAQQTLVAGGSCTCGSATNHYEAQRFLPVILCCARQGCQLKALPYPLSQAHCVRDLLRNPATWAAVNKERMLYVRLLVQSVQQNFCSREGPELPMRIQAQMPDLPS